MTSLYDGLGGEELTQSGLTAGGVSINPYFPGSVTSESTVKGLSVVGTTVIGTTTVSGGAFAGTTFAGTIVSGTTLRFNNAIANGSITNADGYVNSVRQGASYGGFIQAGSSATGAGSNVWVVYPVAYTNAPQAILVSPITTASGIYVSGTATAGSFIAVSEGAAQGFHWISVGVK